MRISGTQPGVRFLPEDDQIILYLLDKVTGNTLPGNPVFDYDLYDEDEAWKRLFLETGESELYVFTRLRKGKSKKGESGGGGGGGGRIVRTVGSKATWRSSKDDSIYLSGQEKVKKIGSKRTFTYRLNQSTAAGRRKKEEAADGFSMTEYRLDGDFDYVDTDLVLCSVRRKEDRASSEIEIIDAGAPPMATTSAWYLQPCGSAATHSAMGGMVFSC